jgi:nuclear transcription factor Y alpha
MEFWYLVDRSAIQVQIYPPIVFSRHFQYDYLLTIKVISHSGDCKPSGGGQKSVQGAISLQTALPEYYAHFDLGFGQPVVSVLFQLRFYTGSIQT